MTVRTGDVDDLLIRPMAPADLHAAERLSAHAFRELDRSLAPAGAEEPTLRPARAAEIWVARTARFLEHDCGGCWAADLGGELVGFATSFRRETSWFLATYAVAPGWQGRGLGKGLLEAALTHAQGCLRGMLAASSDPRAVRRYRLAGFDLHPQMTLAGTLDRSRIPAVRHVRDGTPGDREWMDSLDRGRRGSAHGPDHDFLSTVHRLRVVDGSTGRGYAYGDERGVVLLAADNRRTATRLLWDGLAALEDGAQVRVAHVTGANQWAVEVGVEAGLSVRTEGYLGLRGLKPPAPYLHHGSLL